MGAAPTQRMWDSPPRPPTLTVPSALRILARRPLADARVVPGRGRVDVTSRIERHEGIVKGSDSDDLTTRETPDPPGRESLSSRMLLRIAALLLIGAAVMPWWMTMLSDYAGYLGFYDYSFYFDAGYALRLNRHANVYDPHVLATVAAQHGLFLGTGVFQYPLLLPILFIPISRFSMGRSAQAFIILNCLLWLVGTGLMIGLLRRGLFGGDRRLPRLGLHVRRPRQWAGHIWSWWQRLSDADVFAIALVTFVSLTDDPLIESVRLGQASILIFFAICLTFWLMRRERAILIGVVIAVAIMIKALPLVLLGYFVLRGRWRVAIAAVLACVAQLAAMALVVGPQGLLTMRAIAGNGLGDSLRYQNEALARVPFWVGIAITKQPSTLLLNAGYGLIAIVVLAFIGGVLRVTLLRWPARKTVGRRPLGGTFELVGFAWAVCTMVLVSPISWVHHSAWLVPPFALCLGCALRPLASGIRRGDGRLRPEVYLVLGLVVGILLTMFQLPFGYDRLSTPELEILFLHHPIRPLYMLLRPAGALLLWLASGVLYWRLGVPAAAAEAQAPAAVPAAAHATAATPQV